MTLLRHLAVGLPLIRSREDGSGQAFEVIRQQILEGVWELLLRLLPNCKLNMQYTVVSSSFQPFRV